MLKFAICDDEPFMCEELSARITSYMDTRRQACQVNCYTSGKELLKSGRDYDILFLDIQMDRPNGMEAARILRRNGYKGLLIFTTVLEEYVFHAFELQAFDYFVKPIDDKRFLRTMDRALKTLKPERGQNIVVQKGGSCEIIPFSKIIYCEILGRKVYLHRQDGGTIDYYDRLEHIEACVDGRFFRCHRSYLVNLDYVHGYRGGQVLLSGGEKIPVSRLRERELSKALLLHMKEGRC